MAYDETLAQRVRKLLTTEANVTERKMFGGLAFMLNGNMCCGIVREELMLRTGPDQYAAVLARPGARPMDFTGRPMKGMVMVAPDAFESDDALAEWVNLGVRFTAALPPK